MILIVNILLKKELKGINPVAASPATLSLKEMLR